MVVVTSEQMLRSYAPITDEHLRRLAELADEHHRRFAARHANWAREPIAACLVQGGARHRVHADRGVKDLDVYLFYALAPEASAAAFPWNRNTCSVDFGASDFGRQLYTDADRADPTIARNLPRWERFAGRRVDLMARAIAAHVDGAEAAVRAWLERGARKRRRVGQRMDTSWHLARTPVVCLDAELGALWWSGPDLDEAGIEKGAYDECADDDGVAR